MYMMTTYVKSISHIYQSTGFAGGAPEGQLVFIQHRKRHENQENAMIF